MMWQHSIYLLFYFIVSHRVVGQNVSMPPTIIRGPDKESHNFRDDDDYVLDCIAEGIPKPEYEWLKDGELLTNSRENIVYHINGTTMITKLGIHDEGSYQCRAFNEHGTALSRVIVLRRAMLAGYPQKIISESPPLQEGTNYTLDCLPTKCHPKPVFSWTLIADLNDEVETPIYPDQRVQMDENGNLHFSYVLQEDSQNGKLYKCKLFNNVLDVTMGGSYSRLNVIPVQFIQLFAPVIMFSSKGLNIGLEQQEISLRCFFAGNPDPIISWYKDGASLPIGRYSMMNRNTEIIIRDLVPSDAGSYRCTAQNTQSQNVTETIIVDIQAIPVFRLPSDNPNNINVTEGSDVQIHCKAYAKPTAHIQWFKNGIQLNPQKLPSKFQLSEDLQTLTISNVCKECVDGSSDLMVIQCNASNVHGYAFADGYINILRKTVITVPPENITMDIEEVMGEFSVEAYTDLLTPLTIQWYHVDEYGNKKILKADEPFVKILESGARVQFFLPHNSSHRANYRGAYESRADNTYSNDSVLVYLHTEDIPLPPPPPELAVAGIQDYWWIIVLVIGLFLLFLLLLLCCCCCYRNRGDVYPVDKKERKNGNDPEKELADSGFFDYRRPEVVPVKDSRVSLNSSMSLSDDEVSLNEYGDIDGGKFTEEGSFVDDYTGEKKDKSHKRHSKA